MAEGKIKVEQEPTIGLLIGFVLFFISICLCSRMESVGSANLTSVANDRHLANVFHEFSEACFYKMGKESKFLERQSQEVFLIV